MTHAQFIMLGIGAIVLIVGVIGLYRSRSGTESQIYARRLVGTMAAALGAALIIFALGLAGKLGGA